MSCNTKTSLAAVIDAVNAQLNNNYVDRDDPRINQGVFTEPTIRGGLMLDEAAKLDFCGYVTECGQREPFGKQWVDRPLYPDNTLVSYEDGGEIKSRWQDTDDVVAGTAIGESYAAYAETRSLGLQGYTIIDSFELGATITQRDQALRDAVDGKLYRWAGDLPKVVPASSTPTSSGGMGDNAWLEVSDVTLRQELANPGMGAAMVARSVVAVDSIADLLALAEGQRGERLRYEVRGFYSDSLSGGGPFIWDPHHNKSLHNGITVLDPTAVSSWDGTVDNINDLFDHNATGSGCYIRLNEERIPISASGAVEGGDLYQHLKAAVRVNAKFSYDLKDGYINNTTPINLSPLGIDMRGVDKENRISVSRPIFNLLGDAEKLILTNMTLEGPTGASGTILSGEGGDYFIKRVIVDDNVIRGPFRLTFWNGGGIIDPNITPYGILYLSLSGNEMYDITRSFAVMASLPVKHAQVVGNTIRNFSYTFLNLGILNEHTIGGLIKDYNELLRVEDNTVICDDDFYGAGTPYYAFVVTENLRTIYRGNHVEGMKSLDDAALYDIYASSDTFESSDNTYKNNVCLNPGTIWPLRALCKVKGGRSEKFFRRNKYIIDDDIHERWGVDEDLIIHSLADYRELGVEISDCEFKLKSLATRSSASPCDYLRFTGNTITADKVVRLGGTSSGDLLSALPVNGGEYIFKDNDLHIRYLDQVTSPRSITFFRVIKGEGEAVFMRNSLTTDDPSIKFRLYELSFEISQRSKDVDNFVGSAGYYNNADSMRTCATVGGLRVNVPGDGVNSMPILHIFPGASELTLTVGTGVSTPLLRLAAPPEDDTAVAYTLRCEAVFLGSIHRIAVNLYMHRLSGEPYLRYQSDADGLWVDQKEATSGNYNKVRLLAEDVIGDATLFNISNWNGMGVRLTQGEVPRCIMKWEIVGELIPSSSMPDVG